MQAPGYTAGLPAATDSPAFQLSKVPLGRVAAPEEIAAVIVFLASEADGDSVYDDALAAPAVRSAILPLKTRGYSAVQPPSM